MPHLGPLHLLTHRSPSGTYGLTSTMELVILLVLVIMIFGLGKLAELSGAIGKGTWLSDVNLTRF